MNKIPAVIISSLVIAALPATAADTTKALFAGKTCRAQVGGPTMGALKMDFKVEDGELAVSYRISVRDQQAYYAALDPKVDVRLGVPVTARVVVDEGRSLTFQSPGKSVYVVKIGEGPKITGGTIDGRPAGLPNVAVIVGDVSSCTDAATPAVAEADAERK